MADHFSSLFPVCLCILLLNPGAVYSQFQSIRYLDTAVSKGAVCLNGSPSAYYLSQGSGSGVNNWMIYLEGGGWCETTSLCLERSRGWLGDTYSRPKTNYFDGMLGQNQTYNPDFYNWNKVYIAYCDGSSFLGDVEEIDPQTNLTYRGSRIFDAVMEDLFPKGLNTAENVMLSGSSAGGLATILHCDNFSALLPNAMRVKCISDSGFFLHAKNLPGAKRREEYFSRVVELHGLQKLLPSTCTSKRNPGLCLFPEYLVEDMKTPLFILDSLFDFHQLKEMLTLYIGGGRLEWRGCINNLTLCNSTQIQIMHDFQQTFIDTLQNLKLSSSTGMFLHTCYLHTHIELKRESVCSAVGGNVLEHKSVAEAIGDWYYDRSSFQHIDTVNHVPRNCSSPLVKTSFSNKCIELINQHKV